MRRHPFQLGACNKLVTRKDDSWNNGFLGNRCE